MIIPLTSTKNENIKNTVKLIEKSRQRRLEKMTVVEGINEIKNLIKAGYEIQKIFFSQDITDENSVRLLFGNIIFESVPVYKCSADIFSKISYRESTGGIVCVVKTREKLLNEIDVSLNEIIIVIESIEKPGNLGAVCRIADGAGIKTVLVCDPLCDIYNPNTVRSSIGCVFNIDVISADSSTVFNWLKLNSYNIFAAELKNSNFYYSYSYKQRSALVFGTEAYGLSDFWINNSDHRIKIPMLGINDSLNISVSVAVIVYEALRQRNFLV